MCDIKTAPKSARNRPKTASTWAKTALTKRPLGILARPRAVITIELARLDFAFPISPSIHLRFRADRAFRFRLPLAVPNKPPAVPNKHFAASRSSGLGCVEVSPTSPTVPQLHPLLCVFPFGVLPLFRSSFHPLHVTFWEMMGTLGTDRPKSLVQVELVVSPTSEK